MSRTRPFAAACLLAACGDPSAPTTSSRVDTQSSESGEPETLQEPLRLNHLQALGTHNSYHLAPSASILAWRYSHRPLDEQLEIGVRQFELDLFRDAAAGDFDVYHLATIDQETNCPTLTDCLETMLVWSQAHPEHHPVVVLLEPKDTVSSEDAGEWLDALESIVSATWPRELVLSPDLVAREHGSLRAGLAAEGWPTIDALRGRTLFVLHTGGVLRDELVERGPNGPLLFPDAMGDLAAEHAAFHSINDPIGRADAIAAAVELGHLVRTRADADNVEPTTNDVGRRDAALAGGAHLISTDWPEPASSGYVVTIPGGTPSRCNPTHAPVGCTSTAIEDLGD